MMFMSVNIVGGLLLNCIARIIRHWIGSSYINSVVNCYRYLRKSVINEINGCTDVRFTLKRYCIECP